MINAQTTQEALNAALKELTAWKAAALAAQAERILQGGAMINQSAVFTLPKNNAALILLRETQKQVRARSCANGWALVNGEFVHHSKAKFIRKLEEA